MTPAEFIAKWKAADLSERSAAQQHFLDLCELLGQKKPAEADPKGEFYTFERGVEKTSGRGPAERAQRTGRAVRRRGRPQPTP